MQNGVHYFFTSKELMQQQIKDGKFLETATVHSQLYGTSRRAVQTVSEAGKCCILDIDVQVMKQLSHQFPQSSLICCGYPAGLNAAHGDESLVPAWPKAVPGVPQYFAL